MHAHGWPDQPDFYLLNLIQPLIPILAHHLIALVTSYLCMYMCEWERVCKCLVCRGSHVCICLQVCAGEEGGGMWWRERERERWAGGGGWVWAWRRLAQMVFAVRAPHIGWASTLGWTTALQRKRSRGRGGGGTTDWAALAEIQASDAHRNRILGLFHWISSCCARSWVDCIHWRWQLRGFPLR